MTNILKFIIENWDKILGAIIAYFSLILPIYKYLQDKRKEERDKRFENYHRLIDELVGGNSEKGVMLDRQTAIVYEFRHFREYYPVTLRILNGLKETWKKSPQLVKEIELTEKFIKASSIERKFYFKEI